MIKIHSAETTATKKITVAELVSAIRKSPARSKWSRGVRQYAVEIVNLYDRDIEWNGCPIDLDKRILVGADNWTEYSRGGCSLILDVQICARLATKSESKKKRDGELPPNKYETWIDVQARALRQASGLICDQVAKIGGDKK